MRNGNEELNYRSVIHYIHQNTGYFAPYTGNRGGGMGGGKKRREEAMFNRNKQQGRTMERGDESLNAGG